MKPTLIERRAFTWSLIAGGVSLLVIGLVTGLTMNVLAACPPL